MIQQFSGGVSNVVAVVTNAGVQLAGLALFDDGTIAVSDAGNHVIWQVDPVTRAVSLLTGSPGVAGQHARCGQSCAVEPAAAVGARGGQFAGGGGFREQPAGGD